MSTFLQKSSSHLFGPARRSIPVIVPCLMGEDLNIDSDLVNKGLSAISIKHKIKPDDNTQALKGSKDHVIKCTISFSKKSSHGLQQRNSFWNVHRPDLAKLNLDPNEITLRKVETFFRQHSSTKCLVEEETQEENNESLLNATSFHDMTKTKVIPLSRSFFVANDSPLEMEISMSNNRIS